MYTYGVIQAGTFCLRALCLFSVQGLGVRVQLSALALEVDTNPGNDTIELSANESYG